MKEWSLPLVSSIFGGHNQENGKWNNRSTIAPTSKVTLVLPLRPSIVIAVSLVSSLLQCSCQGLMFSPGQRRGGVGSMRPLSTLTSMKAASSFGEQFSKKESVAIIGGGWAGLHCAQVLSSSPYFDVTVYDTGRLRPGGRASSRFPNDAISDKVNAASASQQEYRFLSQGIVDHAAQIIAVPTSPAPSSSKNKSARYNNYEAFLQQLKNWEDEGIVVPYKPGNLFTISPSPSSPPTSKELSRSIQITDYYNASSTEATGSIPLAYYAPKGLGSLAQVMAKDESSGDFTLCQDVWVSPSNGAKYMAKKGDSQPHWQLQASGKRLGQFDHLIIAHNGKCADRLMSKTPAKDIHSLLRVNFQPSVNKNTKRMTLNSIYSLTFAVPETSKTVLTEALPPTLITAMFPESSSLKSLTCQTRKFGPLPNDPSMQVWTVLSSGHFAKRHKAPQEFLPPDVIDRVTDLLLTALDEELTSSKVLGKTSPLATTMVESRLQLWGAAVPLNTYDTPDGFFYDQRHQVGVCGDWLTTPSLAGAWTSGHLLGKYMVDKQARRLTDDATGGATIQDQEDASSIIGFVNTFNNTKNAFVPSIAAAQGGIGAVGRRLKKSFVHKNSSRKPASKNVRRFNKRNASRSKTNEEKKSNDTRGSRLGPSPNQNASPKGLGRNNRRSTVNQQEGKTNQMGQPSQ